MESGSRRPGWTTYVLMVGSVAFAIVGVIALFLDKPEAVVIASLLFATALLLFAVLEQRLVGVQKLGPSGIALTLSEIIAIQDAEQEIRSGKVETVEAAIEEHPAAGSQERERQAVEVLLASHVVKDLEQLPAHGRQRVMSSIESLRSHGLESHRVIALASPPGWYVMRAGSFRIVLAPLEGGRILISSISSDRES
jgi:hypothetical protein